MNATDYKKKLWRKMEYPEKPTDLIQVTDKLLSHNVVMSTFILMASVILFL